ncbi:hypothetical protein PVAP13_8KG191800 [Panicum virgatum]|uniref:Uncharacterized protein n=1 Tax=Panicum virgatum TaxID=38727 RepID=A0A8T0PPU0_PANVG|nr:hypothetical protein PVAP13_8KG191800 [Panicum virgatum]
MVLLKSITIRMMYLTTAVFLVFVITSSTFPSCQAGNIIKGHHSPPPLSTVTCYTYRQCDITGCGNHCVHKGKKREGCECRTEGVDPSQCCCKD